MAEPNPANYALVGASEGATNSLVPAHGRRTCHLTIKRGLNSRTYRFFGLLGLVIALFGGSLCILTDVPDEPTNHIVDGVMLTVMAFFLTELILRCIVEFREYPFSFFFWMDVLGTLSMIFEISFLLGDAGKMNTTDSGMNTIVMRTSRAARVGARAGRLSKPLRCLALFSGRREEKIRIKDSGHGAKVLGARLTQVLSTKVATLTIVLVLGVPIFNIGRYPQDDFSLRLMGIKLESDYARAWYKLSNATAAAEGNVTPSTRGFDVAVQDMVAFYANLDYRPFRLMGYEEHVTLNGKAARIRGQASLHGREPNRKQNIVRQEVAKCLVARPGCDDGEKAAVLFDFKNANQYEAVLDVCVVVFIILCMGLESCDLSRSINKMVVAPLEKMLESVQPMASVLNRAVRPGNTQDLDEEEDEEEDNLENPNETDVLERIFKKMAHLTTVFVETNVIDETKMEDLDVESKGVIVDLMQYSRHDAVRQGSRKGSSLQQGNFVTELPVPPEQIQSWGLNLLEMSVLDRLKIVKYVMFDSSIGQATGRVWVEGEIFLAFGEVVRSSYLENPYHSFTHGCDVVASTYRLLLQMRWTDWLSDADAYALLVSALCHDLGHPGKTNPFLVEMSDELALRYNDKSPLENMHCARLFEICRDPKTNVFKRFDKSGFKQVRSVCISAILCTDNALHFDLVKDIKRVYETSSDLCNEESKNAGALGSQYAQEVVCENAMLWIKVVLHMADVSNPLKDFEVNRLWATRVVDEFFAQGDEEKRLGLPVGMLNDRDKVNRSSAEHGFINFLLSPFVLSTVSVFPMLQPVADQMARNMRSWLRAWVQESSPPVEDIKKREADVEKVELSVAELKVRQSMGSFE